MLTSLTISDEMEVEDGNLKLKPTLKCRTQCHLTLIYFQCYHLIQNWILHWNYSTNLTVNTSYSFISWSAWIAEFGSIRENW